MRLYTASGDYKYYDNGFNLTAFSVTLVAVILSLGGKFIPFMEPLSRVSWFVGVIVAFVAYALLKKRTGFENTGEKKTRRLNIEKALSVFNEVCAI